MIDWNQYDALIFDVDGTLYNQKKMRMKMVKCLLKFYLLHWSHWKDLLIILYFRKVREQECYRDKTIDQQYQLVAEHYSKSFEYVKQVITKWMYEEPLHFMKESIYPEVVSIWREKQKNGAMIIVYSDYPASDKLRTMGLTADWIYSADMEEIQELKPSKKAMELMIRETGIDAKRTAYIGDRYEKDGKSAEYAGIAYIDVKELLK